MQKKRLNGFTLIEMLLVLVVISSVIYMSMQYFQQRTQQLYIDKTVAQIQQTLNAGLSYYVANGEWPITINCLRAESATGCTVAYLPSTMINSPYGYAYWAMGGYVGVQYPRFYVFTTVSGANADAIASVIAGKLPMSYTANSLTGLSTGLVKNEDCVAGSGFCVVVASITMPGLNNASNVNFAGLYHHGACVPVPTCPNDANGNAMSPQIMVVPVSVSGVNDVNSSNIYPLSSFTAYASGSPAAIPPACTNGTASACDPISGSAPGSGEYWRVCLQVVTEKGDVSTTNTGGSASASYPYNPWGGDVTLMAITRCSITNEPAGSDFTVFTQ